MTESKPQIAVPQVPLTLEGAPVLHSFYRLDWAAFRRLTPGQRAHHAHELSTLLQSWNGKAPGKSGLFTILGHKADLLLVHFRDSFEDLSRVEVEFNQYAIHDVMEPTSSYVSVVELGLYESTGKVYGSLAEQGLAPFSEEWTKGVEETLSRQRNAMSPRLYPEIPDRKYVCFYPMDRKRGEHKNWYSLPLHERARMMHEHGMVGRRYADSVKQIISGSIGFDDWEWGVTLFSDDALVFKKLIYEMRFDEVSAEYALFGKFYFGIRLKPEDLAGYFGLTEGH